MGDVPTSKLFEKYVKKYNIVAKNSGWLKYALTTPLSLRLFCELNQNKTVSYSERSQISMTNLLREKIRLIEQEFSDKNTISIENQYIFKSIVVLAETYLKEAMPEREILLAKITSGLSIDDITRTISPI